jgi:hypothetical protein
MVSATALAMSASSAGAKIMDSSAGAYPTNVWLSVSLGPARTDT